MNVPTIEVVPDDVMRRRRATSLNRLCNVRDWEPRGDLSEIMGELREPVCIHRKAWEYAICILGMKRLGRIFPTARALSVGAGYERPLFYFANHIGMMVATDLYENPEHEGKPAMLRQPEQFAPFEYRRDHLKVMRMNGKALQFADSEFDFAFCLSSIEHFGTRDVIRKSLDEMIRVVRPHGVVCITTEIILNDATHAEYFTPPELTDMFLSRSDVELVGGPLDLRIQKSLVDYPADLSNSDTVDISPHVVLRVDDAVITSVSLFLRRY